ncbi:transcription factor UNE10-like [Impatiens glandulifera]|uniref:transcription factor UNE10-like n=1 Tax=Impatiens glandulifera TaxID=253017 RepID=UPI001FB16D67|nr:transcription factor UNE10-like [Impatiens glandulifera]
MNQCVPSWGFNGGTSAATRRAQVNSNLFIPHVPSMLDEGHEVAAEIIWEKGELVLQGLTEPTKTMPILLPSPENNFRYAFDKPRAGGTLESVVNQVTQPIPQKLMAKAPVVTDNNLFPWFYAPPAPAPVPAPANLTTMDALVPCSAVQVPTAGCSAGVGSCSGKGNREVRKRRRSESREESSAARVPSSECSDSFDWESGEVSLDTSETETERETGTWGLTSTSMTCGSPENTSFADQNCSTDEYDSACQSRTQVKRSRRVEKLKKSSISSQRSTTASSTQNQSDQRRRDKIKQRMVTLQKMVPNSNKIDKVAVLDEVIEHLKQLQSQVEMMNRMNMVVAAPTMHQMMLNMMMGPTGFMGMGPAAGYMGMGVGMGLDPTNAFPRPNMTSSVPTRPPSLLDFMNMTTSPFLMHQQQPDPMSMFMAYQSQQLTTMEGYGRMAAFFNQTQLPPPPHGQLKRPS